MDFQPSPHSSFSLPKHKLEILLAQLNFHVGDIKYNERKIREVASFARELGVDLLVFPEMALSGYPIQDLIFDRDFYESEWSILKDLASDFPDLWIIVGGFGVESDPHHHPQYQNLAYILHGGHIEKRVQKRLLPTYDVFDEKRYFWEGKDFSPLIVEGFPIGIAICEDLWDTEYQTDVAEHLVKEGARFIISINGSPYVIGKQSLREKIVKGKAQTYNVPVAYLNLVGGQDELVFDGRSFAFNSDGTLVFRSVFCEESLTLLSLDLNEDKLSYRSLDSIERSKLMKDYGSLLSLFPEKAIDPIFDENEEIVRALSMNLRDYYEKTGIFKRIVLGLSGGIDSAFTAYIASRAVGPEKVTAILMPSRYSSEGSIKDSIKLCENLGIEYHIVPIKDAHSLLEPFLLESFKRERSASAEDLACQNLQSRLRGIILMFYSNLYSALLVSTGNKSELATGYCTLYGDTNGGKNVPGDLYKTQLYEVVHWINREEEIIPKEIVEKPPSAELKENQVDEDTLPPYPILDEILRLRIDEGYSPREIIKMGKDPKLVMRIEKMYTHNEYKRAQVAQTIKINKKTFGMGRKIPVLKRSTY